MKITYEMLEAKKACHEQLALFKEIFPNGSPESKEEALRLAIQHSDNFNWDWAARNLLSAPALKAYDEATASARKAYNEAKASALKAYNEVISHARKAYNEATAPARKAYNEATAPALKAYNEVRASARKAYNEAKVLAFVNAWFSQESTK